VTLAIFYVLAAVILASSVGMVTTGNVVHAALLLLAALGGVAGLFVLLFADFLALVQVLIYGGAIVIVILFALMLTRRGEFELTSEHRRWPFAAMASAGLFTVLTIAFVSDSSQFNSVDRSGVDIETLATVLFEKWALPFEIASLVLLVALVGAIVIARSGGPEERS